MNATNNKPTVEELKAKAAACYQEREDSFARCDTDGFLSQWASGLTGQLHERRAEVAANGWKWEFWGLYTLDGRRVKAKLISGKYGECWMLLDARGNKTRFVPVCEAAREHFYYQDHGQYSDAEGRLLPEDSPEAIARKAADLAKYAKRVTKWEAKHGLSMRREQAPADAKIDGSGTGLSGRAWVSTYRTDGGYPADAVVID